MNLSLAKKRRRKTKTRKQKPVSNFLFKKDVREIFHAKPSKLIFQINVWIFGLHKPTTKIARPAA